jgi:hypothetical protein
MGIRKSPYTQQSRLQLTQNPQTLGFLVCYSLILAQHQRIGTVFTKPWTFQFRSCLQTPGNCQLAPFSMEHFPQSVRRRRGNLLRKDARKTRTFAAHRSLFSIEEPVQQPQNRRLSTSARAHNCQALASWNLYRDVVQNRPFGQVAEFDAVEADGSARQVQVGGILPLLDGGLYLKHEHFRTK